MRVPPFAVTYAVAVLLVSIGFRRHKSLLALGALMISVATINAYIEEWPSLDRGNFASVAPPLLFVFMLAYTALTMSLVEKVGAQTFSRRFVISMLPFLYLLVLGVVIQLPAFGTLENPPLALYVSNILTVVLHVPAFAFAKGKLQSSYVSVIRPADSGMRSLLQTTFPFLAAPLFAIFIIQLVRSGDCMLWGCNAVLTVVIGSLFAVAR